MREVFDIIRQVWVAATPEEIARQTWIQRMIGELKFPRALLAVEKELKTLPHLAQEKPSLPNRRIDILCFMKIDETVRPLLLIECKEAELTQDALDQVAGYNYYVGAPYVAIVNQSAIRFRCDKRELFTLPSYLELIEGVYG